MIWVGTYMIRIRDERTNDWLTWNLMKISDWENSPKKEVGWGDGNDIRPTSSMSLMISVIETVFVTDTDVSLDSLSRETRVILCVERTRYVLWFDVRYICQIILALIFSFQIWDITVARIIIFDTDVCVDATSLRMQRDVVIFRNLWYTYRITSQLRLRSNPSRNTIWFSRWYKLVDEVLVIFMSVMIEVLEWNRK